ncbi:MAG: hypothetical protein ACYC3X_15285 [Pirellulaceae bacterium]
MRRNMRHAVATGALLTCGFWALPCLGAAPAKSQPDVSTGKLVELARAAKTQFRPLPPDHAAKAKAKLQQAVDRLDEALRRGSPANAQQWREYIQWDAMMAELGKSDRPDSRKLGSIATRYYQDHGSLDLPAFTGVRDDLVAYLTAMATAGDERLAENYTAQLDQLIEKLPQYDATPTSELRQQIGQLLAWLENARQASAVVTAVRQRHWQPNLYAEISQRLVSAGIGEEVNEASDVQDCILGTSISGTAAMSGNTQVRFVDDPDNASLQIVLAGTVVASNVGYNRGVKILSRGSVSVEAVKPLRLDPLGFSTGGATATCATESTIDDISAKCGMVERIAWKRAGRSKAEAEQIGSRHAEQRIASRMDERAATMLAEAKETYNETFRRPLLRRGEFPQAMKFRTLQGFLNVVWRQAGPTQLAASTAPPTIAGQHDAAVRVHESMVSNLSRALLGGVTLTDKRLVELLEKNKGQGEVPEELRLSNDKEPWSITFSANEPVNASFAEDTIRFAIRGRRFELGDTVVTDTLEMSAVYRLEKTPEGAHLIRQGDVSVDYIDPRGQLRLDQIAVRTVMRKKFEALFAPEFNTTGIVPAGKWEKMGKLHLEHVAAQRGWLSLAWLQVPSEPKGAKDAKLVQSN